MPAFLDRTGVRYGRLVAQSFVMKRQAHWWCVCDCGKKVLVAGGQLSNGNTQSCGCLQRERTVAAHTKHGHTKFGEQPSPTYRVWRDMIARCFNEKRPRYERYGGRGITVCKRWLKFENFLKDMGERPSKKHTLERKNNDGNYTPKNCVWATGHAQDRNKSNNVLLTFHGRTQVLSDWAVELKMDNDTLRSRLLRGWTIEEALTRPVDRKQRKVSLRRQHLDSLGHLRRG